MIQCWNVPIKKESCQSKETVAHPGRHPCGCPCAGVCGHVCLAVCSERQNGFRQGSHGSHWGLKTPPTGDITTKGTPDLRVDIRNKSHTNRRERDWGAIEAGCGCRGRGDPWPTALAEYVLLVVHRVLIQAHAAGMGRADPGLLGPGARGTKGPEQTA